MKAACDKSFGQRAMKKITSNKSVSWWTEELAEIRKRTNALRRRYHRSRKHEGLREQRTTINLTEKARIKWEKIPSKKEYCNLKSSSNPWNEVYKLTAWKRRNNT